jgi:hypothetical protein
MKLQVLGHGLVLGRLQRDRDLIPTEHVAAHSDRAVRLDRVVARLQRAIDFRELAAEAGAQELGIGADYPASECVHVVRDAYRLDVQLVGDLSLQLVR